MGVGFDLTSHSSRCFKNSFAEGAGAKASRVPLRGFSVFSRSLPIPADAPGAYHPNPQATIKGFPGRP